MKPGIWFEFEACCRNEKLYKEEYLLKRHGKVIGGDRAFLDFRNPEVKKYLPISLTACAILGFV